MVFQERSRASIAAQGDQTPASGSEKAEGELQSPPHQADTPQGATERENDDVSRARLEKEEAAAMEEDENRSVIFRQRFWAYSAGQSWSLCDATSGGTS